MGENLVKVAICDNNIRTCSDIEKIVMKYCVTSQELISVEVYYSGKKLCDDLRSGMIYDLLFLDIELGDLSGVEVGHVIREVLKNEIMQIIYISSYKKYALDLFKVRPMDFLIKPITSDMVYRVMKIGKKLIGKSEASFQYKQGRNWNKIYIKDILYFKGRDREVEMVTINGEVIFYSSLENIFEQLKTYYFFYAHKSFLVNYIHIKEFYYNRIIMSNKEEIKIAQKRRKEVREIQKEYLMREIEDAN